MNVRTYQKLDELPDRYKALLIDPVSATSIFQALPWLRNLADNGVADNTVVRIYGVESNTEYGTPLLLVPLCHQAPKQGLFPSRNLAALATFYTSLFSPLLGKAPDQANAPLQVLVAALVAAIAKERPRWDTIDLHPMDAGSPAFNALADAFRKNGMAVQRYFCFGNWYLDVNGRSFDEYCNALPSKLRNTLERKSRQLKNGKGLCMRIFSSVDEVEDGIDAYEAVYRASWKTPETHPAFMPNLIRTCASQGWLRLGIAYIDAQPAAAQVWIVYNNVASIYKLAYDEQFASFSIGTILTARLMRHVIDTDKVREVDYLTGDDNYKKDWMSHRRERSGLIAFNLRTARGLLGACKNVGGHAVKKIIRSIRST